jgi:lysophospholipase L1-like esterase
MFTMKRMKTAMVYVASAVVGLLLAEAGLRLVGVKLATSLYEIDTELGWALRAGAKGVHTAEGGADVRISAQGMRDDVVYAEAKAAGVRRIAVLGDSFAEAMQVNLEETFAKLLERRLGGTTEVLNFGVQGYGTAQQLLQWRRDVRKFAPDAVVVMFYTGNDVYNNHRALNPTNADAAPYFVEDGGELRLEPALAKPSAWREIWAGAAEHSYLARFLAEIYYQYTRRAVKRDLPADYMDRLVYSEPESQEMKEAWRVTEKLLLKMRDEIPGMYLLVVSSGIQSHPEAAAREEFFRHFGGKDLYYPERRVENFARRHGIRVAVLADHLRPLAETRKAYFHGFAENLGGGHWNQDGHREVASFLAGWLSGESPHGPNGRSPAPPPVSQ